ncbi:hypothetical protein [Halorubrum laminariae]|uniref:ATP-binding protein n=1 Tax=Halorubrum laminariae TaxID=1433523 RepID=A0ABD6BY84_9EURY|nr:hypothetical protein [Halorubrum laminariae]
MVPKHVLGDDEDSHSLADLTYHSMATPLTRIPTRKDKRDLFMITQNPEDIDSDILKQTNTNIFLGLREEVITKVPSIPRGYEQDLQKYGKGQAVIKAPDVEAVEVKGLSYCLTQHSS